MKEIFHQLLHVNPAIAFHFISNFFKNAHAVFSAIWLIMAINATGQTNNYFGTGGALGGSVWSTNPAGPYTSPLNTTGGAIINFGNPATATGATITVAGINATADVGPWTGAGTLGTGGLVINVSVAGGITLNMISQTISAAAGTGFNKMGAGVLALNDGGPGAFTLTAGTIIVGGVNGMGTGTLNLNGGIVASTANLNLSGKYPGGINIGGDVQFGDVSGLASNTANLTFNDNIFLGAINRTLTLGNAGTTTFGGIIGGTGGISFTKNSNGTGLFDITNTANIFSGPVNINGGQARFAADGSFGNATNTIVIDGGKLLTNASFSIAHAMQLGITTGTEINVGGTSTLTIDAVISDKTISGGFTKTGTGTLILNKPNSYTGTTTIAAGGGILQLSGVNALPITNNVVVNGGTFKISGNQTLNDVNLVNGNLLVDNGVTLTINGTLDYFQPGNITLTGTGKIVYGTGGTLKYSGTVAKTATALEWPAVNGPVNVNSNNSSGVTLPTILASRIITGSLSLTAGTFIIGSGVLLDLNGASLVSAGGFISGTGITGSTSDITVRGSTGGTVTLPTPSAVNIGLRNVTVGDTRTLALNGTENLVLSGLLSVGAGAAFDNGGESQVIISGLPAVTINGKFINRDKDNFTGANGAIPSINPTLNSGCIIEYGLATGGPQVVTSRTDYSNISFSGSGTKTLSGPFNPAGTVYITGAAILDAANHTFGNVNTKLTMDGGRFRMAGTTIKPDMEGVYTLTGGVIEFYNAAITSQTINGEYGPSGSGTPIQYNQVEVTGNNVANSNTNITLRPGGSFTIKSGGVFTINDDGITGPAGTQTVSVESGGIFKTGDKDGFSGGTGITATSINQNIENIILADGSTIDYSRDDVQNITNTVPYSNLTISGTAGVKTAPAGTLTINGNLLKTGAASFAHNNGNVLFGSTTASQNFNTSGPAAFNFYDLTNANTYGAGLTVANNLGVVNALTLSANSKLNLAAGDITLLSTSTATSRVAQVPASASINYSGGGRFVVERFFPGDRSWRLLTSPLSSHNTPTTIFSQWQNNGVYSPGIGAFVTGPNPDMANNGLDASIFNNYSLKKFENNNYVNVGNTLTPLSNGASVSADNIGYFMFVRGDRSRSPDNTIIPNTNNTTLISRGKLQWGAQSFPGFTRTVAGPRNYALIGNPYPSPVNFKNTSRSNLVNRFYVWDPKLNLTGGYVLVDDYNNTGNYTNTPASPGGQDVNIQSGQAFFVETDAAIGPSNITFDESNKSTVNNLGMFRPLKPGMVTTSFKSSLHVQNADNSTTLADGNIAEFSENFNDRVDIQDALKFINLNETFGLARDNLSMAIERRPAIKAADTLFFKLTRTAQRNYQFQFEPVNLDTLLTAFIEDSYTNTRTPVSVTSPCVYNFSVNNMAASAAPNRFRIVFKLSANNVLPVSFSNINALQQENNIAVEWQVENEISISRYDVEKSVDGLHFSKINSTLPNGVNLANAAYKWIDKNVFAAENYYRIKSVGRDGKVGYSRMVKVKMEKNIAGISIYPNPVTGRTIGIKFVNIAAGSYPVKLLNEAGQTVFSKIISHQRGSLMESIRHDHKLSSGIYQLAVTAPDKKITIIKLIVK